MPKPIEESPEEEKTETPEIEAQEEAAETPKIEKAEGEKGGEDYEEGEVILPEDFQREVMGLVESIPLELKNYEVCTQRLDFIQDMCRQRMNDLDDMKMEEQRKKEPTMDDFNAVKAPSIY